MTTEFRRHTITTKQQYGYQIDCKRGLWGVVAPTLAEAEREAMHYFRQYYGDGEYS